MRVVSKCIAKFEMSARALHWVLLWQLAKGPVGAMALVAMAVAFSFMVVAKRHAGVVLLGHSCQSLHTMVVAQVRRAKGKEKCKNQGELVAGLPDHTHKIQDSSTVSLQHCPPVGTNSFHCWAQQ